MELCITCRGTICGVYAEAIPLGSLGVPRITRASHVEPDETGRWWADLAPVRGPRLGPFASRSAALAAEADWLLRYWLPRCGCHPDSTCAPAATRVSFSQGEPMFHRLRRQGWRPILSVLCLLMITLGVITACDDRRSAPPPAPSQEAQWQARWEAEYALRQSAQQAAREAQESRDHWLVILGSAAGVGGVAALVLGIFLGVRGVRRSAPEARHG